MIRGEVVAIQAVVFNYMNKEVEAELTFENIGDFHFIDNGVEDNEISRNPIELRSVWPFFNRFSIVQLGETIFRKKTVRVPAQDGTPVSFLIRPTTLGNIDLRMTAKAATAGDAIVKKLLVKVLLTPMFSFSNIFNSNWFHLFKQAEGETIYRNKAYLLDLRSSRSYTNNVTVTIPLNAVPGSQSVELSAIGTFQFIF